MATVTQDKFSPYPRCCDVCGQLRSIATMRKLDNITWVCDKHEGERTRIMLDVLNANARPPQTWPNEDPKPQNPLYPNRLEADEAELFNFIDQQVTNQARYERVYAGDGSPVTVEVLATMGWSAAYLYALIVQNTMPTRFIARATSLLGTIGTFIQTRQRGFGISPTSTRANSPFYGSFLESGATTFVTQTNIMCGLASLYAYRVFGTPTYLASARAAASFLRNVQAIGKCLLVYFTSSNSAGTARLYTGGLVSEVSTTVGVDPGESFYSTHCFYLQDANALQFWNELMTTDGDQNLGQSIVSDVWNTSPEQTLSQSITDLRNFWTNGVQDSTGTTFTGLSSTTPREFFNAYPATKTNFTYITGTGRWEFADGNASIGTAITAQNIARALAGLYAYEGSTSQVTTIFDWLAAFESNEDFETPDDTSDSTLARSTTGEYDATAGIATVLTVRDSSASYAATAINGSSLYDWGAFGVLSPLWASQNMTTFKNARIAPLNVTQRYDDGRLADGMIYDRVQLRGTSGLSMQTAFGTNTTKESSAEFPCPMLRGRGSGRGSDLQFDESPIFVPNGELQNCDYWRFTSVDDNNGQTFPYLDTSGEIPNTGCITLYNGSGTSLSFGHMASSASSTSLPFYLITLATTSLANGFMLTFARDDELGAWRQLWPQMKGPSTTTADPIITVNDAIRAAQFGVSYRSSH